MNPSTRAIFAGVAAFGLVVIGMSLDHSIAAGMLTTRYVMVQPSTPGIDNPSLVDVLGRLVAPRFSNAWPASL